MIGLSSKELTSIRTSINGLLPGTAIIIAVTNTADGFGGQSESTAAVAGGTVACRLDPRTINETKSSENLAGGAISPFHTFILTLPYDTTITTNNRVIVGTQTYNVTSVDSDKNWKASVRVYVERV